MHDEGIYEFEVQDYGNNSMLDLRSRKKGHEICLVDADTRLWLSTGFFHRGHRQARDSSTRRHHLEANPAVVQIVCAIVHHHAVFAFKIKEVLVVTRPNFSSSKNIRQRLDKDMARGDQHLLGVQVKTAEPGVRSHDTSIKIVSTVP